MNLTKKIILLITDLLIASFSLWLSLKIRYGLGGVDYDFGEHLSVFWPVFLFWLIFYYINDLYEYPKFSDTQQLAYYTLRAGIANFLVTVVFFYIIPKLLITPKTILILLIVISSLLIFVFRWLVNKIFVHDRLLKNLIVVGNNKIETKLVNQIVNNRSYGYNFKGIVTTNPSRRVKFKTLGNIKKLEEILKKRKIDTLAVDVNSFRSDDEIFKIISDYCISRNVEVADIFYLYENITGKVPLENFSQVWFTNFNQSANKFSIFIKRLIDIILSGIGLILFTLFIPLLYLLVRLDSPGSFFFAQERMGKNSRIFRIYKIRTMTQEVCDDQNSKWVKGKDKRVTVIGGLLRRTGIDELPQLWNILTGEMSIVGPRPERPMYIEKLDKRQNLYYKRHLVKPGLTGWAQVMASYGASFSDTDEKLQYDLYYVKNRSLFLDLVIIMKTIRRVFENRG